MSAQSPNLAAGCPRWPTPYVAMVGLETNPEVARVLQVLVSEASTLEPAVQELVSRHDESYRRRLRRWIVQAQHRPTGPFGRVDAHDHAEQAAGATVTP